MQQKKSNDKEEEIIEESVGEEEVEEFFQKYSLTSLDELTKTEERILYHLSGHTIFSTIKLRFKSCDECLPLALTDEYTSNIAKYQEMKDYTGKLLILEM